MNTEEKKKKLVTEEKHDFDSLRMLTEVLRGKGGCPWDIEQTHESIRNDIIEETYEVVEAIDNADKKLLREELGDVMFQVMFHSRIEEEAGNFSVEDVINDVCEKMITRHPHVFGNVSVNNSDDVLNNWEQIKKAEKDRKTVKESMQSVPKQLPALMRTRKIVKKAKKDLYDFNVTEDNIVSLAEKLKTSAGSEREKILTEIIFDAVVLAGDADSEKNLGDKTDEFVNNYKQG
jgi:tetrapyrrole methylase family protein / MazG family protein